MTITRHAGLLLKGLSTDTKPTADIITGTRFLETNTGAVHTYDGTRWIVQLSFPNVKKYGIWHGASTLGGSGLFIGGFLGAASQSVGTGAAAVGDGRYQRMTTAGSTNDNAGIRMSTHVSTRAWNPKLRIKFRVNHTDNRVWLGFRGTVSTDPGGDDDFVDISAFAFGMLSDSTVWQVVRNDGTGATVYSNVTGDPPVDTNTHVVELIGDEANARWGLSLDDSPYTFYDTEVPPQLTLLSITSQIEASVVAARSIDLFYISLEQDK